LAQFVDNIKLWRGKKIGYLCFVSQPYTACVNQAPFLKGSMENKIANVVEQEAEKCISKILRELQSQGYEVKSGESRATAEIKFGKLNVVLNYPLEARKGDLSFKVSTLQNEKISDYFLLLDLANKIVNSEIEINDFDDLSYMLQHSDIKIEKWKGDQDKIYILTSLETGEKFTFALRNYYQPYSFI